MALDVGSRLGHYQVTALIGEGGMGQVYQATDTKLNRQVALKVLPEAFATDPDRLARFQREAQVLASLNHPGIAAIYGIEESDDTRALVLELVEGPTLADRITKGPIPVDEAVPIAKQIAEALEAAHEQGIIHRDLKPANVKVRPDGMVKVLDFGLAKALDTAPEGDPSQSPTLTAAATQMGVIMGTAAYMSPEQARGKTVDRRADIWAFGAVLYEMLTGRKAFEGDDVSLTLSAVLQREPAWGALPSCVLPGLGTYLRRCLQKDPTQRVQAIGDVRLALEGAFETARDAVAAEVPVETLTTEWRRSVPYVATAITAALVAGLTVWALPRDEPSPIVRSNIDLVAGGRLAVRESIPGQRGYTGPMLALSCDGSKLAYAAVQDEAQFAYVRALDRIDSTPLRGTEGAENLFWSPDGQWLGFQANGGLQKVSLAGGSPVILAEVSEAPTGASWGPDGTIVFGSGRRDSLLRVSGDGGIPESVTILDADEGEEAHLWPEVLPGGSAVLFTVSYGAPEDNRIAVQSFVANGHQVLLDGTNARYAPTGHLVFARGSSLWTVPFDLDRLEIAGTPTPALEGVLVTGGGASQFTFSSDGSLIYAPGGDATGANPRTLVWVDREGTEESLGLDLRVYASVAVSPNGARVAVEIRDSENTDVWTADVARGTLSRVTTHPAADRRPRWTPNGERLVFRSDREGTVGLFSKEADGRGDVEPLLSIDGADEVGAVSWSPNGETAVFHYRLPGTNMNVGVLSTEGDRAWQPLIQSVSNAAVSLSGLWIAYVSDETGQREVYVERFPDLGSKRRISTDGGRAPVWSPNERELFYLREFGASSQVWAVPIDTEPTLMPRTPELLFGGGDYYQVGPHPYDLAPDGRFLMIKNEGQADGEVQPTQVSVVLNWFEELKERAPIP